MICFAKKQFWISKWVYQCGRAKNKKDDNEKGDEYETCKNEPRENHEPSKAFWG